MVRDRDARHRRLSAIVFTDIVGFSALVNRDEVLGARALDMQRRLVRRLVPAFGGREIETAGDSFLLEFASPFAALRCVVAIQQALKREPPAAPGDAPVRLRASIHLGDIQRRGREVFGDGVNIAARLMPMAPEGGIAISDQVQAQVRHRLALTARSLGPCELKNIRYPVEVFLLDAAMVDAIPVEVAGIARRRLPERRDLLRLAPAVLLVACLLGIGVLAVQTWSGSAASSRRAVADAHRRIAVLPFTTFSSGADDDMLAAGLQDSILTNLVRMADLKVISRTSVMRYATPITRKLKEIADDLSVDAIIEGSLQRKGDRLLVQVQLIDVATDQHLWAQSYDRRVDDLFDVESLIAREVARAIQVQLNEPVRRVIDSRPTANIEAYTQYQRALQLDNGDYDKLPEIRQHVSRALALDPEFALAHIEQSRLHVLSYYTNADRSEARLEQAKQSLVRAAELRPDLPELHRAWGFFYFYGRRDLDAATAEYEAALRLLPNDAPTLNAIGELYQEQGRLGDALLSQRRALELEPQFFSAYLALVSTLELMRDYDGALRVLDRAAKVEPKSLALPIYRARLLLASTGDVDRVKALMKDIDYAPAQERLAYYTGDIEESMRQVRRLPDWSDSNYGAAAYPTLGYMALDYWMLGNREKAVTLYREVARQLEDGLKKLDAAQWDQRTTLAMAYAVLGRRDEAAALLDTVRREDCCPNPVTRAGILAGIAFTEMVLGHRDAAIEAIDRQLREPSALSWHMVALDPAWRSLRNDPAFKDLLERARKRVGSGGVPVS
ncbi:MAG: hypothetical protein NVS9B10_24460 [Nevskia sp.]